MTGWWAHNEQRDFPFSDRVGPRGARSCVEVGGAPLPRDFLVDAFFVVPATAANSGGSGVAEEDRTSALEVANLRPAPLLLNSIQRNSGNDGFVVIVSPHFDFADRVANGDPRIWYQFDVPDTAERWTRIVTYLKIHTIGGSGDTIIQGPFAGYGVIVLGRSPSGIPTGDAYSKSAGSATLLPAVLEADCVVYCPQVWIDGMCLANKVSSRYPLPEEAISIDGSLEPVPSELVAEFVAQVDHTYPSTTTIIPALISGYGAEVDLSTYGEIRVHGRAGAGKGHACYGIPRVPSDSFTPVSCAGIVKSVGGIVPAGGDLRVDAGPGLSVRSAPGRVTLVLDGEEVVGGPV